MRVQFDLDGETANGELQSSPDAIGVCTVRVLGQDLRRHVNRLTALDAEAAKVLATADRFVARDPERVVERIALSQQADRPRDWTIDDVEALRAYAVAAFHEATRGKHTRAKQRRCARLSVAGAVIKLWLKQSRMGQVAREAGLSEEEARDPICLLQAASRTLIALTKRYREETGREIPIDEYRLASVIRDYLNHHAPPGSVPGVDADEDGGAVGGVEQKDESELVEDPVLTPAQESAGAAGAVRYQREDRRW